MYADSLEELLRQLAVRGISSLMVEGGAKVAEAFLSARMVDRIWLFQGAGTIGDAGIAAPMIPGHAMPGFELVSSEMIGEDRLDVFERME